MRQQMLINTNSNGCAAQLNISRDTIHNTDSLFVASADSQNLSQGQPYTISKIGCQKLTP